MTGSRPAVPPVGQGDAESAVRPAWLTVRRGGGPLVLSVPHAGTEIPPAIASACVSVWRARKDADWWIDRLYDFAERLDATVVRTAIARTVIDVNRDPSGASLYPGQNTTELCPTTTFDGEPLYADGAAPDAAEVAHRRQAFFDPYHGALRAALDRLRQEHPVVVLYDAHAIRSVVPRLFEGTLPVFNIGTNSGAACAPPLTRAVVEHCAAAGLPYVVDGRFKGGYITRAYGRPQAGVHAIQMELAFRGYLAEPLGPVDEQRWPPPYDPTGAALMRATLEAILGVCLAFAHAAG
ncbi:MAG: N-formylglutamate deformylase [Alphaproteobacteria bacterium]|nr:N-formylglutamate deformylase [Alphaproteobacteria bacterium]